MTPDEAQAIRDELDHAEKQMRGYYNALNFFLDSETGDWIATHWSADEWWWNARDLKFGKRSPDPRMVLAALRAHIAGQIQERRAA